MKRSSKPRAARPPKEELTGDEALRTNITLTPTLMRVSELLGRKMFGSRSAYLAHLLLKDCERQNLSVVDILALAEQYKKTTPQ